MESKPKPPVEVWPVVHVLSTRSLDRPEEAHRDRIDQMKREAQLVERCGCAGVLFISMDQDDFHLDLQAKDLKRQLKIKVGVNQLSMSPLLSMSRCLEIGLDACWTDKITVRGDSVNSAAIVAAAEMLLKPFQFFVPVAFKYQPKDPCPARAAVWAAGLGMIPTTSGSATGRAAGLDHITTVRGFLPDEGPYSRLALASGVTADNVELFLPYVSHILVSTGIAKDGNEHSFDEEKLKALMEKVNEYN